MEKQTHFQKELDGLKENLFRMAILVEEAIGNAVQSLVKRDSDLAKKTFEGEEQINEMEIDIDGKCLKLLALMQPMAVDLRFITSAMKITTDLERMGDQAVNIAERAISLNQEPQLKPYIDIPKMAEITQSMVKDVLDVNDVRPEVRQHRSRGWTEHEGGRLDHPQFPEQLALVHPCSSLFHRPVPQHSFQLIISPRFGSLAIVAVVPCGAEASCAATPPSGGIRAGSHRALTKAISGATARWADPRRS